MEENGTLGSYKFADAGSISVGISKEDRAQILNARLLGTDHRQILMFPYNSGYVQNFFQLMHLMNYMTFILSLTHIYLSI